MVSGSDISVVMITMNEEAAVGKVIADIKAAAPGAEVVIVDSSRDRTPEIAEALGAKVVRQFPPQGYGRAMDLALRSGTREVLITLDCDDTYPVDHIIPLAALVKDESWDIVDGSRLKRKPEAMPWTNYLANVGFALIASVLFARRLTDLHSGMRAYRSSVIQRLPYRPAGAALPVELLLLPIRLGYRVTTVFIPYRERIGTSTMRPWDSAKWTLKRILWTRFWTQSSTIGG
jgi:glycosyltransferase involved in cell wall biosynthesis